MIAYNYGFPIDHQTLLPPANPRRLRVKPSNPYLVVAAPAATGHRDDGGQAETTECAGKGVSGIQGGEEMDGTGMEGFGSAARNHDRPKKLPETHTLKASGTESTSQFDFNVLKDGDTLSDHQIELGWKKNRLVVHGDVLRLQTALPTREYYPGNMLHSRECASEGLRASSHERMRRSKTPRRASCCEHGGVQIMSQKIWRGG